VELELLAVTVDSGLLDGGESGCDDWIRRSVKRELYAGVEGDGACRRDEEDE
jgi:hypothetical protein